MKAVNNDINQPRHPLIERRLRRQHHWRGCIGSCCVLAVMITLMAGGFVLGNRLLTAVDTTQQAQRALWKQDVAGACLALNQATRQWDSASSLTQPIAPVLRHLDWAPQVGRELALLPDLVSFAQEGTAAGVTACSLIQPVLQASSSQDRLAIMIKQIGAQPEDLRALKAQLTQLQQSWSTITPQIEDSPRLAPYNDQLKALGERLPAAIDALDALQRFSPYVTWLAGIDAPRHYLFVSHNPFELRPTGGFIALVCIIEVAQADIRTEGCQSSYAYDVPAPANAGMPFPYSRYLRLGNWYLRDANWAPDFPSSARTIQEFLARNGRPEVDGVIAIDLYALQPLLRVTGPLKLDDGTKVTADNVIEILLDQYYNGEVRADKERLGALFPQLTNHLQGLDAQALPELADTLHSIVMERHLQAAFINQGLAETMAVQGWDGGIHRVAGDVVRVIDADVGYGDVNAFIERLSHYDIALDDRLHPLTATLTLTYTNHYSPWTEAPTSHAVHGRCTDPATLMIIRHIGCYANYVRVYVPQGSQLISIDGVEESLGVDQEYDRQVFGGYVRVMPGEQRVVRLSYRLPLIARGTLTIEKQGGTLNLPWLITARTPQGHARFWTNSQMDRRLTYRQDQQVLQIEGPSDSDVAAAFARAAAYNQGLVQWQNGQHTAASNTWQAGAALDRAVNYARALAAGGDTTTALTMLDKSTTVAQDGYAAFELAALFEAQGNQDAADRWYERAAQQSPDHPLAQMMWAMRCAANGESLPDLHHLVDAPAAVRRWRERIGEFEQTDDLPNALAYLEVLLHMQPDDRALVMRYADVLLKANHADEALEWYTKLQATDGVWGSLAGARRAQLNGDPKQATALYERALTRARTYAVAYHIGEGMHEVNNIEGAIRAYRRAAELAPQSIWPVLQIGHLFRDSDPIAAREWYERARRIDPESGYPDFAIAKLLIDANDFTAARSFLESAVIKEPNSPTFQKLLLQLLSL